jgi:hypothetical protein
MRTRNEEDKCCREWRTSWKEYGNVARGTRENEKERWFEEEKGRGQRTEDREEGLEKQKRRNGKDTICCVENGKEGGRLEKRRVKDREQRIGRND